MFTPASDRARVARIVGLLSLVVALGCASTATGPSKIRFHNAATVWRVEDRVPVPKPKASRFLPSFYHFDQLVYRPVDRALGVPQRRRAANVNALGEVPSSSWFANRLGRRELSTEEVERGPVRSGGPDLSKPLEILSAKTAGAQPGFVVRDARGDRYLIKFDRKGHPVAETAAHVVVNRLLWAAGYHVAEDSIVFLRREDLVVAEGATRRRSFSGEKKLLTQRRVDKMLRNATRLRDGRVRVLASRYLPGKPLGGFAQTGTRADDPNDRTPHERRRELRGMYVFFSWLKSTDMKTDNSLDMWEETSAGRGAVRHYLIDFGMSLGANGLVVGTRGDGYERFFDWPQALTRTFTFGLVPWHWESFTEPGPPHVGVLEVEGYRPDEFHTRVPYLPWLSRDRFDTFWAAKILANMEEGHVRAAVRAAHYPDPRSAEYVVTSLLGRRRVALRHWFSLVTPVDEFEVVAGQLCFTDLGVRTAVLAAPSYAVDTHDFAGRALGTGMAVAAGEGRYCASQLRLGAGEEGYTIAVIRGTRGGTPLAPVDVHLATDPRESTARVIGVYRH